MKAKKVFENIDFKRGIEPKESLQLGINTKEGTQRYLEKLKEKFAEIGYYAEISEAEDSSNPKAETYLWIEDDKVDNNWELYIGNYFNRSHQGKSWYYAFPGGTEVYFNTPEQAIKAFKSIIPKEKKKWKETYDIKIKNMMDQLKQLKDNRDQDFDDLKKLKSI